MKEKEREREGERCRTPQNHTFQPRLPGAFANNPRVARASPLDVYHVLTSLSLLLPANLVVPLWCPFHLHNTLHRSSSSKSAASQDSANETFLKFDSLVESCNASHFFTYFCNYSNYTLCFFFASVYTENNKFAGCHEISHEHRVLQKRVRNISNLSLQLKYCLNIHWQNISSQHCNFNFLKYFWEQINI